jgi:two-component system nitrate/nitrite response regulator NarL
MQPAMNSYPAAAARTTGVSAATPIRVFVAEDHHVTLWGLTRLIDDAYPRLTVVGSARSRAELLGHDAAARERCPGRVLVLTGTDDIGQHRAAVMQGARGVVHKSEPADVILRAIEKVHEGEVWLNRALLGQVLGELTHSEPEKAPRPADPEAARIGSLTRRERDIVTALVNSAGAKQFAVAQDLGMSEHTLRNHLTTIYSKLGVHGRLELHVYASAHGLGAAKYE